jgi:uncharacterized membrane protein YecN with MAPEG domain
LPSSELMRWSGLAAILGGVLLSVGAVLHIATETENLSESATTAPYALTWLMYLLGGVLVPEPSQPALLRTSFSVGYLK